MAAPQVARDDLDAVPFRLAARSETDRRRGNREAVVPLGNRVLDCADHLTVHHDVEVVRLVGSAVPWKGEGHFEPSVKQVGLLPPLRALERRVVEAAVEADVGADEVDLPVPARVLSDPEDALLLVDKAPSVDPPVAVGIDPVPPHGGVDVVGRQEGRGERPGLKEHTLILIRRLLRHLRHQVDAEDLLPFGKRQVDRERRLRGDGLRRHRAPRLAEPLVEPRRHSELHRLPRREKSVVDRRRDLQLACVREDRKIGKAVPPVHQAQTASRPLRRFAEILPLQLHDGEAHLHLHLRLVGETVRGADLDGEDVLWLHGILRVEDEQELPLLARRQIERLPLRPLADEADEEPLLL